MNLLVSHHCRKVELTRKTNYLCPEACALGRPFSLRDSLSLSLSLSLTHSTLDWRTNGNVGCAPALRRFTNYACAIARSFASESSPVSLTKAVNFESGF